MTRVFQLVSAFTAWVGSLFGRPTFDRIDGSERCTECGSSDIVEGTWHARCGDCGCAAHTARPAMWLTRAGAN